MSLGKPTEVDRVGEVRRREQLGHPFGVIVDGDLLVHSLLAGLECEARWPNGIHTLHVQYEEAWEAVSQRLEWLKQAFGTERLMVLFSGDRNWRKEYEPTYKAHRQNMRRPLALQRVKDTLIGSANYRTLVREPLEADDLAGILATDPRYLYAVVIVSEDKDWLQLPGYHWRGGKLWLQEDLGGDYLLAKQTLVGDKADNFPGCPGVGEKTADDKLAQALRPHEGRTYTSGWGVEVLWDAVVGAFKKALAKSERDPVEAALRQWRLARLVRHGEYDFETGELRLWTPPGDDKEKDEA